MHLDNLETIADAIQPHNVTRLPAKEHDAKEWRTKMSVPLLVAERDRPELFARIAMMQGAAPERRATGASAATETGESHYGLAGKLKMSALARATFYDAAK